MWLTAVGTGVRLGPHPSTQLTCSLPAGGTKVWRGAHQLQSLQEAFLPTGWANALPAPLKEDISSGDWEALNFQTTTFRNHFVPIGPCARAIP